MANNYRKPLSQTEMKIIAFNLRKRGYSQAEIDYHIKELIQTTIANHKPKVQAKPNFKEEFQSLVNKPNPSLRKGFASKEPSRLKGAS